MHSQKIKKKIEQLKDLAYVKDAVLIIDERDFIDDDHLDCVWYGGEIATVEYNGMTIEITVNGDVRLEGIYNGQWIDYKNKSNSGAVGTDFYYIVPDDLTYRNLISLDPDDPHQDHISILDNNWVEMFADNIAEVLDSDNVLEAIEEVLNTIEDIYAYYSDYDNSSYDADVSENKQFYVSCTGTMLATVEVFAKTEKEAIEIAKQKAFHLPFERLDDYDWNTFSVETP